VALTLGMRLGPYEILAPLGAGGMGEVYRAKDTRLSRIVAVNVLPADVSDRRPIAATDKPVFRGLCVSPDGRWILYSQGDQGGSDLMLVENFQ
jgi:serine/threonine protein kinase